MATKAQKSEIIIIFLNICLISLLFNGSVVFSSSTLCAFKFIPDGKCENSQCADDCKQMTFWVVKKGQDIPEMSHICSGDTCFCSAQLEAPWSKGKAISSYNDFELELPPEEGQEFTYDECVNMCITFNYEQQKSSSYDDQTKPEDLWFHVVGNGNCYCKAKPQFAEDPMEGPDYNDLLAATNDDANLALNLQFGEDQLYDDDDGFDFDDDVDLDDVAIDYIEGSEDDPLVQEKRNKELRKKRRYSRMKQREVELMPVLAEAPEDDDDDLESKRVKRADAGLDDDDDKV